MAKRSRKARIRKTPTLRPPTFPWLNQFRWHAAALATLVLLVYWSSLGASFHFDDWSLFSDPQVAGPGLGWKLFRLAQTRPLTYWTFHLNFLAGGSNPLGYHLLNMFLHAGNAVLVLWIARQHLPPLAAFLAGALFAAHPLQSEAVTYIFARSSLLATFFTLLCFTLFLRGRYGWSAGAFAVSLLAKEETVALPAFLLLYDYLFVAKRKWREPSSNGLGPVARRKWYYAALALCSALAAARLFYVLHKLPDPGVGFRVKGVGAVSYALTQARVIWRYLRLVVLPTGQNLDYDFRLSTSLLNPAVTLPAVLALAALLGGLAVLLLRGERWGVKDHPAAFWVLGFFLLLAPSSSVVAQSDVIFEHRTYLPMTSLVVALAWLAGQGLERIPGPGTRIGLAAALIGVCAVATLARNEVWATELLLWSDVVSKSPNKGRPYIGLARGLSEENQAATARRALERGLELDPRNAELHTNLGITLLQEGNGQAALEHFRRALELGRETPEARNNIGAAHYRLAEREKAIEAYRRALALEPCFYNARRNLVMALSEMGRKKEALEAGSLPGGCRLLPEQARDLEEYLRQVRGQ